MKIGKFEILAELGQGAMGKVYRARDPNLDRVVALKTVAPGLLATKDARVRFEREARAAAKLQHPNIVTIYELGEVEGILFIAMELIEGLDLGQVMVPTDRFSVEQKVRMVADVSRGLDFAHKQGVVHRDVKPANVRVGRDGVVKILDFGIARLIDSDMTQAGTLLGTPSYMSPEVLRGARVDHRADMWATGVILYEILSGRRPFEAKTITSLVYKIVHEPLPPLDYRQLGMPEPLVGAAMKALSKDPSGRFDDMAEMARILLLAIGDAPPVEPLLDPAVRKRAFERNFEEAQRLLSENDLSGALEAARRAQSLDPSRTGIIALVGAIEEQLRAAVTVKRPPRLGPDEPTRVAEPPGSRTDAVRDTRSTLTDLRTRGAAVFRELATFGEPPATQTVALSPVKDLLAVAGADGAIRLWDLHTRAKAATLRTGMHQRTGHDALALSLAFSPDGGLLASGHVDGNVHLWDLATAEEVPVRLRHEGVVGGLAFSPDGSTLASGSMDSNLRLWDVGTALAGEARRELHRQPAGVTAVTYAAGGDWILTGHSSRILRLLDARTGRLVASMRGPEAQVSLLCLSPDGRHVAVAGHDRVIRLFDLATRGQTAAFPPLRRTCTALSFLSDGSHLASVSQENSVQLWDLESGTPRAALWGQAGESFVGIALLASGDHLVVALADGRIRVWGPGA
jgi:eukaryotic-like serine/threonine-protein kinase